MSKLDQEEMEEGEGLTVLLGENTEHKPERKIFRRLKSVMTYHSIRTVTKFLLGTVAFPFFCISPIIIMSDERRPLFNLFRDYLVIFAD